MVVTSLLFARPRTPHQAQLTILQTAASFFFCHKRTEKWEGDGGMFNPPAFSDRRVGAAPPSLQVLIVCVLEFQIPLFSTFRDAVS